MIRGTDALRKILVKLPFHIDINNDEKNCTLGLIHNPRRKRVHTVGASSLTSLECVSMGGYVTL